MIFTLSKLVTETNIRAQLSIWKGASFNMKMASVYRDIPDWTESFSSLLADNKVRERDAGITRQRIDRNGAERYDEAELPR